MSALPNQPPTNPRNSILESLRLLQFISEEDFNKLIELAANSELNISNLQKLQKDFEMITKVQERVPRHEAEVIDLTVSENKEILEVCFRGTPLFVQKLIPNHIKQSIVWLYKNEPSNKIGSLGGYNQSILKIGFLYYNLANIFGLKSFRHRDVRLLTS